MSVAMQTKLKISYLPSAEKKMSHKRKWKECASMEKWCLIVASDTSGKTDILEHVIQQWEKKSKKKEK